jgi:small subunit ribosomal protein S16
MSVKIRLQRHGRKKAPFYHIVVADSRAPRDGRFIEKIGTYNPMTIPATIDLDREKAYEWMNKGAQPTDTTRAIMRYKGIMYRIHLMRGVKKGSLTVEQADAKYNAWIDAKESKISTIVDKKVAEKKAFYQAVVGTPKPKKVVVVETVVQNVAHEDPELAAIPEEVVVTPAVEAIAEPVVEVAPVVETIAEPIVEAVVEAALEVEAVVEPIAEATEPTEDATEPAA